MREIKWIQTSWINRDTFEQNNGWVSPLFYLMSWSLSSLLLSRHSSHMCLYGDQNSGELLIDKLQLPYSGFIPCLETFHNPFPQAWVLNKMYVYAQQKEPFVHVDNDAFLFHPLTQSQLNAPFLAQNLEENHPNYIKGKETILATCSTLPSFLTNNKIEKYSAINAGIVGGKNFSLFEELYSLAIEFLEYNPHLLHALDSDCLNVCIEQLFLHQYVASKDISSQYLLDYTVGYPYQYGLDKFTQLPRNCSYVHVMNYKKNSTICEQLAQRLYIESPELYERCFQVYRAISKTSISVWESDFSFAKSSISKHSNISLSNELIEDICQFEKEKNEFIESMPDKKEFLKWWKTHSIQVDSALKLEPKDVFLKKIRHSNFLKRIVSEWNWCEASEFSTQSMIDHLSINPFLPPTYFETLLYVYPHQSIIKEQVLDVFAILILDTIDSPIPLGEAINNIWNQIKHAQAEDTNNSLTKEDIFNRICFYLYQGILEFEEV
jgi:hypothetical protein